MMEELFNEETMRKQLDRAISKREFEKGIAKGKAEGIAEGRAEGIAEGKAEGKAEEKISVALNLLSLGTVAQEDIAKATNLTLEKIKELSLNTSSAANI